MVNEATGHVVLIDFDLAAPRPAGGAAAELASWADVPIDEARAAAVAFEASAADGGAAASAGSSDATRRSASAAAGASGQAAAEDSSPRAAAARAAGADAAAGAQERMFAGTVEYAAPEVVCGAPHGAAADMWQVGVLLYELLYGRTPFRGRFDERTFYNVVAAPLATPPLPPRRREANENAGSADEEEEEGALESDDAATHADAAADAGAAAHAIALLRAMLARTGGWRQPSDPRVRLGGGEGGSAEVRAHPFFAGVDWATLPWARPPCLVAPVRLRGSSVNLADVTLGAED
jgi:serine/threonine protein kinase